MQEITKAFLLQVLGLTEKATEEEILAAIERARETLAGKSLRDLVDAVEAAAKTVGTGGVRRRPSATERHDLLYSAIQQGKVTVDNREEAEQFLLRDVDGFKEWLKNAPVLDPDKDTLPEGKKTTGKNKK